LIGRGGRRPPSPDLLNKSGKKQLAFINNFQLSDNY
jgi:hypothetical protein